MTFFYLEFDFHERNLIIAESGVGNFAFRSVFLSTIGRFLFIYLFISLFFESYFDHTDKVCLNMHRLKKFPDVWRITRQIIMRYVSEVKLKKIRT